MSRAVALALMLSLPSLGLPSLALADDGVTAVRFEAKKLQEEFPALPVFSTDKGKPIPPVDGEVMLAKDPDAKTVQASYAVNGPIKKVVEFFKTKLATEPKVTGDETLGDQKFTFQLKPKRGDKRIYKVVVASGEGTVQIIMYHRPAQEEDMPED